MKWTGALFWISIAVALYVYFGYPLLVFLLSRLRRAPGFGNGEWPTVTVVISACREEAVIARKLRNVLELDYPGDKLNILVAVDGDDDRTADIVKSFEDCGVELDYSPERHGKTAALNRVFPRVRGEIVVFSDANNMYPRETLRHLVRPFQDDAIGAVSGAKHITKATDGVSFSEGLYWRYESALKRWETRLGCCVAVCGEILAIRHELLQPISAGVINDDFHLAMKILARGYRIVYEPRAVSVERASSSARDEMVRRKRIVAGRSRAARREIRYLPWKRPLVLWQIVSHKFMRPLVACAMVTAALASVLSVTLPRQTPAGSILYLTPPWNWIVLGAQAAFYLLAWIGNRVPPQSTAGRLLYLPAFLLNSNVAALTGITASLTGRQSAVWERVNHQQTDDTG